MKIRLRYCDIRRVPYRLSTISHSTLLLWAIWLGEVGRCADFLAVPSGQWTCSEPR